LAQLVGHDSLTDYVGSGLHLDADFEADELTISEGVFYTSYPSDEATSDGETIFDLGYVSQVQETALDLPDSGDHYVVAYANIDTTNSPSVGFESDENQIPDDAIVVGQVFVDDGSVVETNRESEVFEQIQSTLEEQSVKFDEHTSSTTDVHGVGDSYVASVDNVDSVEEELDDHTSATTDIHGVGDSDVASVSDIEDHRENSVHEQPQVPDLHGNGSHTETFAVSADLINQKERIDQLRIDFALDGVGMEDAFYENFVDTENIVGSGGVNLVTGTDAYVEVDDFINIDETVTSSSNYSYDKHPKMDVSDFTVDVTGVDNVGRVSDSGTISDGSEQVAELPDDAHNGEITLSASVDETDRSLSSDSSSSDSIDGGTAGDGVATVSLEDFDNGSSETIKNGETISLEPGLSETFTRSTDINSFEAVTFELTVADKNNVGESAEFYLYIEGELVATVENEDRGGATYTETYTRTLDNPIDISGGEVEVKIEAELISYHTWIFNWEDNLSLTTVDQTPVTIEIDGASENISGGSSSSSLSSGSNTVDVTPTTGTVDYSIDWTERDGIKDPSVTVDGSTVSHDGVLDGSITESVAVDGGSNTISASYSGEPDGLSWDLSAETTTETTDPSVTINGQTANHSGTLDDGQTVSLDVDGSWISDGTNTISVELDDPTVGPEMRVGATIKATTGKGVVELGEFNTDYVIAEMIGSNTIENGSKEDVNIIVEDENGNEFLIDNTNIDTFVQPSFDGQNANVTLELLNYGPQLTEVSLFTNDTVEQ